MTTGLAGNGQNVQSPTLEREDPVTMPDMFVSFLAQEPQINPHYEKVKQESESWISKQVKIKAPFPIKLIGDGCCRLCHYDDTNYKIHVKADFPYFVAIWAREAGLEEFRTICDCMNWIFDFDDIFDEGCFQKDTKEAKSQVTRLIEIMSVEDSVPSVLEEDALLEVFRTVWCRVAKRSSKGARKRFVQSIVDYTDGVIGQVDMTSNANDPSEENFLANRRQTIGAGPCFALIEYFYGLDLPDEVFEHPAVQQLDRIAREMILMYEHILIKQDFAANSIRQNDALSFPKELADGVGQNFVAYYGHHGMPPQQAYDKIDVLLKDRYRQWYLAQADLPQWGESIDKQVQKYIRAMQDVITANMYWSFRTTRYFGKNTENVRKNRVIMVPSGQLIKNGLTLPNKKTSHPSTSNTSPKSNPNHSEHTVAPFKQEFGRAYISDIVAARIGSLWRYLRDSLLRTLRGGSA